MCSSWLSAEAYRRSPFERVLGLRRDLYGDYEHFAELLWTRSGREPALVEL